LRRKVNKSLNNHAKRTAAKSRRRALRDCIERARGNICPAMKRRKHRPARSGPGAPETAAARMGGGEASLWLYGQHAVQAALANPRRAVRRLLVAEPAERRPAGIPGRPAPETVERRQLERLLPPGAIHQGIAAEMLPLPPAALDEVLSRPAAGARRLAVLDQVSDPRNVGAVLRSAAAFAIDALVLTHRHAPPESAALAKAASGALETVTVVRVANLAQALEEIARAGFWRIGLDAAAPTEIGEADLSGDLALVLGAEGRGLRRLTAERCDLLARLPMAAAMASLNVSAAAAIAFYLAHRAR
jgi:23S rRNA (guanosine2251-2'-O)-methyltransferase